MEERKISICTPDDLDHRLWRYIDFLKFVDLLQRRALWFSRLDQLGDPHEGSLTKPTAKALGDFHSRSGLELARRYGDWERICVSCWHMSDYESAAMWALYSKESGIAVCSRISRRQHSFPPEVTGGSWGIVGSHVHYKDYETDDMAILEHSSVVLTAAPFMCKRKSFEHEREYRLSLNLDSDDGNLKGKHVPALLESLIEKVVVSPLAQEWVTQVVRNEIRASGLNIDVEQSDLHNPLLK